MIEESKPKVKKKKRVGRSLNCEIGGMRLNRAANNGPLSFDLRSEDAVCLCKMQIEIQFLLPKPPKQNWVLSLFGSAKAKMEAEHHHQTSNAGGIIGGLYVKVMTDDQMELLRQQISVYATICQQLVEMHKAVTTQQDLAGFHCFLTQQHYSTYYYCFTPQGLLLQ